MPRLSLLFARRYLFSPKSHSVINIISAVSAFAVGIPVAAMVILLSVFNGFEDVVKQMFKAFDPDIAITVAEGKFFDPAQVDSARIMQIGGVDLLSYIVEDNALLEYRGRQYVATVKGVDSLYEQIVPIHDMIVAGEFDLMFGDIEQAVIGQGIAYNLGVNPALYDRITFYTPTMGSFSSLLPLSGFRSEGLIPSGVFMLDAETDGQYVIVPKKFAQRLFDTDGRVSQIAVKLHAGASADAVRVRISEALGDGFKVQTRFQQKESLYRIMTYEKWAIFFIIALVMVIASFSVVGSLVMLVIEKRKDIRTIITLGGDIPFVRKIFVNEGMLISMSGAVGGLMFGIAFCLVQQWFGLIKIPARTFLVDSYPVIMQPTDIVGIVLLTTAVSYTISLLTVRLMIPKSDIKL